MVKSKTERTTRAANPYARVAKKAAESPMEPSTPSTQGTTMSDEELEADLSEVREKVGVSRKLSYNTKDDGEDTMSVDENPIPKKVTTKKLAKVCYTPPVKAPGK
jgi:hypothetical protein